MLIEKKTPGWILASIVLVVIGAFILLSRTRSDVLVFDQPAFDVATSTTVLVPEWVPLEGPFSAKVTLVEFLDYQCGGCAAYHPVMTQIREDYKGRIKFVVRHFPLVELHQFAKGAAISAVCAQRQGKFFEFSDVLFQNQTYLRRADLERYAEEMGLNIEQFKSCLDDKTAEAIVIRDRKDGEALGIPGTPALFLNGKLMRDLLPLDQLKEVIEGELKK